MKVPGKEFFESKKILLNPRYIKKNYPEFFEYLNNKYPDLKSISEKIYWWKYNLIEIPKCPVCGKPNHYISLLKGYSKTCCYKCSALNIESNNMRKQTCLERYGVENPNQSEYSKQKSKQTCLERYGVENPFQNEEIKNKIKQANLERYGVKYTGQIDYVKDKIKNTLKEKYGVESPLQLEKTAKARENSRKIRAKKIHEEIIDIDIKDGDYICKCPHPFCNKCIEKFYTIKPSRFFDRQRDNTEPCTRLLPIGLLNDKGTSIELYIQFLLNKLNIKYETNNRSIIHPKELDIYIPDKKIAIECNGIFTHSTYAKEPSYHINKTKLCEEQGIQLIHIWEDWIKNKPNIVNSIIKSKLGIYDRRIYARRCDIKEIKSKECNIFLENNHIQGRTSSNIKLGLYYNNELVSVMTFCKKKYCQGNNKQIENEWELNRFCSLMNTQVIGGASKLFKYFIKNYNPKYIISFSCNDISNGGLYKKLGFISTNKFNQSYWYIKPGSMQRYHRSTFTKSAIVKLGWKEKIDNTWTESEVMREHRYLKIYDSGQKKWIYKA